MRALPFVWPYAVVFWLAYLWSFASEYRIVSRSVLGLLLLAAATLVGYGYRVAVEERVLVAAIGEPYRIYMKECKRFIPYIV